jgi:hypothetical protein
MLFNQLVQRLAILVRATGNRFGNYLSRSPFAGMEMNQ